MQCLCGSGKNFETCCEPYIKGDEKPPTAEALMRSRYVAYTMKDVAYLEKTLAPEARGDFDRDATREWAGQAKWYGLEIVKTEHGGEKDTKGMVEFIAKYEVGGKKLDHHEVSTFRKDAKGHWLFVDGDAHTHEDGQGHHHHAPRETFVREAPKVGRNDACTCGSGKKYKKCCGAAA